MIYGYAWISTDGQSVTAQVAALRKAGKVFREVATGAKADRPAASPLAQKKEAIRRRAHGATLDELARSYNVSRATISRLTA
jgi:DNA invertase Pin-like site-specific DNA recombinase